ncbi:MAG: right-handed parallel beta-helix repeat-containing protein [Ignavibacteriaceae bacterium]|nr:right-handed parallel beta-helix repeat-containing protein [Ignavibacteriaceae bacterium]
MRHTEINSGYMVQAITNGIQKPRLLSISNSIFNNSPQRHFFHIQNTEGVNITLSDNSFTTGYPNYTGCLYLFGFNEVEIIRNTINYTTDRMFSIGINSTNNKSLNINHCNVSGFNTCIQRGYIFQDDLEDVELIYNEDIRIYNCSLNGGQNNNGAAISIGLANNYQVSGVKIDLNTISDYKTGIQINNADNFSLGITNNSITDYGLVGILVSNGSEALIKENLISADASTSEHCVGISVNQVSNPIILGNTIEAYNVSSPGSGISLVSCNNGEVRLNTIQNHLYGIELGSSSPKIGANTIINNKAYGIYISDNSNPDLTGSFVGADQFPLSGYNTIRENGLCTETRNSELYLLSSLVKLEKGCNTIADDRDGIQQQCNNLYLVDGSKIPETIIQARGNYWGNHPFYGNDPSGRFGEEVTIDYSDFLNEPCTYSQGEAELILANSKGEVYDTVYSTENTATGLSDIESRYATANNYYYNNLYNQAKQEYEGIIQNYGNSNASIQAYNQLYTVANLTNSSPSVFNQLKGFYLQQAANQTDSLMIGTLKHLSDLCLVSAEEYLPAINNFDEIAQQNPNTDIALYRQIDALTTSLLMPQDSCLNKGVLGKYSVTNLSEYTNKLNELLSTRGKSGLESEKELLPTEYTLYQNYPNPFNPTTTIKYDLPNTSDVSLIIYDILGRKVKELVNTKQQAGRYEIQFNASNLASGVYIYQLIADKYFSSRKMILLK